MTFLIIAEILNRYGVIVDPSETIVNNKDRFAGMYISKKDPGLLMILFNLFGRI